VTRESPQAHIDARGRQRTWFPSSRLYSGTPAAEKSADLIRGNTPTESYHTPLYRAPTG
jgi:hypothetical protein